MCIGALFLSLRTTWLPFSLCTPCSIIVRQMLSKMLYCYSHSIELTLSLRKKRRSILMSWVKMNGDWRVGIKRDLFTLQSQGLFSGSSLGGHRAHSFSLSDQFQRCSLKSSSWKRRMMMTIVSMVMKMMRLDHRHSQWSDLGKTSHQKN
jgi:hypothetical protein